MIIQQFDFRQRKIDRIPAAVLTMTIRKHFFHIRSRFEMNIVQTDEYIVARQHEIRLNEVRPHRMCHRVRFQRMLRKISTCATVGNSDEIIPTAR